MKIIHSLRSLIQDMRGLSTQARLLLLATVIDGTIFSAWNLFFNFYILERGFDRTFLGLANAMPSMSAMLFGIPIGMLSDRIGRKRAMIIGLIISTTGLALQVTIPDPSLILAAGFLAGLGSMLFFISQAPFMMKVSDSNSRTLLFSLNFGLFTLSGAVGNLFAGQLPDVFATWFQVSSRSAIAYQAVLICAALLSFTTLIPLFLLQEPAQTADQKSKNEVNSRFRRVLFQPLTWKLALPNLLIGIGAAVLIPYMNVFLHDRFAISDQLLGALFSIGALLTGIGSIITPRIANRLGGKVRATVFTQATSILFLLTIGFAPSLWMAGIAYLVRGMLMNMAVPLFHAFAMEQVTEDIQGAVNSVMELAWQFGYTAGPYISGIVQQHYGFSPLFFATSIAYAVSTLMMWVNFHRVEKVTASG